MSPPRFTKTEMDVLRLLKERLRIALEAGSSSLTVRLILNDEEIAVADCRLPEKEAAP